MRSASAVLNARWARIHGRAQPEPELDGEVGLAHFDEGESNVLLAGEGQEVAWRWVVDVDAFVLAKEAVGCASSFDILAHLVLEAEEVVEDEGLFEEGYVDPVQRIVWLVVAWVEVNLVYSLIANRGEEVTPQ